MTRASAASPIVFALLLSAIPGCGDTPIEASDEDTAAETGGGTSGTEGTSQSDTSGDGCPVGSEGCPCTDGGGCDPGLTCLSEVCVDASGTSTTSETGDPTTGDPTTGDPTTGDSTGDPDEALIDDLEDGDPVISPSQGRIGAWYTFNDGSGSQTPSQGYGVSPDQGGFMGSDYAAHTVGQDFSLWGAGMGLDFVNPQLQDESAEPYDASEYLGITFWVRGSGSAVLGVAIEEVIPQSAGGSCTEDCYNKHAVPIQLSAQWQEHTITWSQLEQNSEGGGLVNFDPTTLMTLDFQFNADDDFDLWIDDVSFF